jgi:hypothetical protein
MNYGHAARERANAPEWSGARLGANSIMACVSFAALIAIMGPAMAAAARPPNYSPARVHRRRFAQSLNEPCSLRHYVPLCTGGASLSARCEREHTNEASQTSFFSSNFEL